MSLVEQALKKMQASQSDAAKSPAAQPSSSDGSESTSASAGGSQSMPAGTGFSASPGSERRRVKLDRIALRTAGLLPQQKQERRVANEFRHIKRPLIMAALGKSETPIPNGHLIMVASALSGEGKTFTSINLALSIALEKDVNVLLVDADVAKPHISHAMNLAKEPGLVDALVDPSLDVESLIIGTDVPGLSILPAGKGEETATELLASERMEQVIKTLGREEARRIIVFDSPPLLLTNESRSLSEVAGQIVLVVRANATAKAVVFDALSLLGDRKSIGLVLNQSETGPMDGYYGYGYGYGNKESSV